jgi:anti-sigma B factor antagonist
VDVRTRSEAGAAVISLDGRLTIGGGDVRFRDELLKVLEEGHTKIVIDVRNVDYVDSAGIGELIRSKATAASRGAEVKLAHVQERVTKALQLTRLIGVFDIHDDTASALRSF